MADIGGILIVSSFLLLGILKVLRIPRINSLYGFCLTVAGIIIVFIGRRMAKGNMFTVGLSDTGLMVGEEGIRVGEDYYPLDQITDLGFWIEGYDGMMGPQFKGYRSFRSSGRLSGADNKIHFRVGGKRHLYQFYLQNDVDMRQLGSMFRIYYSRGVPFRECNRGGTTFLFQQVRSKKEFEEMKRREGYA